MCAPSVNTGPPSLEETRKARSHLKTHGWLVSVESALNFSSMRVKQSYWGCMVSSVQLVIPTDWKMGIVAPLWKEKGDVLDCNSLRRCYTAVCARQGFSKDQPWQNPSMPVGWSMATSVWLYHRIVTTDRILALRILMEWKHEFSECCMQLVSIFVRWHRVKHCLTRCIERPPGGFWGYVKFLPSLSTRYLNSAPTPQALSDVKVASLIFFPVNSGVR